MRNIARRNLILSLVVAALLGVWGCGSSNSGAETSSATTKSQVLKEGDQICKARLEEKDAAVKAALEALPEKDRFEPSKAALGELGESVFPPYQKLTEEFSKLPIPKGDEAALEKITAALESGLNRAESDPASVAKVDLFKKAGNAARTYGFSTCNL